MLSSGSPTDRSEEIPALFLRFSKDNWLRITDPVERAKAFIRSKSFVFDASNEDAIVAKLVAIEIAFRTLVLAKQDLTNSKLLSVASPEPELRQDADKAIRYFMGMSSTDLSLEIEHLIRAMAATVTDPRTLLNIVTAFGILKSASWFDLDETHYKGNITALRQSMSSQSQELSPDSIFVDLNLLQLMLHTSPIGNDFISIVGRSRCKDHDFKIIVFPSSFDLYVRHKALHTVEFQSSDRITLYHLKNKTD
jgi:hypothetical protein